MTDQFWKIAIRGSLAVLLAGCIHESTGPDTNPLYGASLFEANCVQCHGAGGKGGGAASLGLGVVPPALTSLSKRNGGKFPRDYVMSVIDGYNRREHPAAAMPEFGATDLGPVVLVEENGLATLIPSDLLALAAYLDQIQD